MKLPPRLAASLAADRTAAALAANPPPAELEYLTSRIGPAATLALIEAHGGTRVPIPRRPTPGCKLARLLGLTPALALADWRGGEDVKIPLAKMWRVRVYRAAGASYNEIALRLGIGVSAVHHHLQLAGLTNARQPSLFD